MENHFDSTRSTGERVVIGALVILGVAILVGIQSLFLTHVQAALPDDSFWRAITILCFLAPPVSFGLLVLLKLNYSRSSSQDWILMAGMGIELLLFAINMIVAVNARAIEGTLLGIIGIILGGIAGLVSAGTVAFTLSADPLRGVQKQSIQSNLALVKSMQDQHRKNVLAAMNSDTVRARTESGAQAFVMREMSNLLGEQLTADADHVHAPPMSLPDPRTAGINAQLAALQKQMEQRPVNGSGNGAALPK